MRRKSTTNTNINNLKFNNDAAYDIIDRIKPDHVVEFKLPPAKPSVLNRMYSLLF